MKPDTFVLPLWDRRSFPSRLSAILLFPTLALPQTWAPQTTGTTASLRGISVVSTKVVWASGADGTWLSTIDAGANWHAAKVPGAEALDFRGVRAIDARTAYLMSAGPGDKSRIYKTTDAGDRWTLLLTNPDAQGFFDAIAFWDARHGIVMGDPVDGRAVVMTTIDGGEHWTRQKTPPALPKEGAFAASNSCLALHGNQEAWFATGGPGVARIHHSSDGGVSWTVASTSIRNDSANAGIFSLAFSDGRHGIAVGGDYSHDKDVQANIAFTTDAGATWSPALQDSARPHGYRSTIVYLADRKAWLAAGTSGSDISLDDGKTWKQFDDGPVNAIGAISSQAAWAVGPKGRIAKMR